MQHDIDDVIAERLQPPRVGIRPNRMNTSTGSTADRFWHEPHLPQPVQRAKRAVFDDVLAIVPEELPAERRHIHDKNSEDQQRAAPSKRHCARPLARAQALVACSGGWVLDRIRLAMKGQCLNERGRAMSRGRSAATSAELKTLWYARRAAQKRGPATDAGPLLERIRRKQ